MKIIAIAMTAVLLGGCAGIKDMIPSRWDVNQAKVTTDIRQTTRHFDCKADLVQQLKALNNQIEWFDLYAESKGTRDVAKLTATMKATTKEFLERSEKGPVSPLYCDLKRKILIQQADMIAHTVQGRF